jgi:predicted acetyltransferase
MSLILRELTIHDEPEFQAGWSLLEGDEADWYSFAWKPGVSYAAMIEILRKEREGIDLAPGRVPHTVLYGFADGRIVGRVSVRHRLNEALLRRGGHLGYWVARRYRRKGYATEMFRQAQDYCRTRLRLTELRITCADENVASWKMIERAGGKLIQRNWDENEKEYVRFYSLFLRAEEEE